ncbi:MAG: DUF115 domain-containing protein [Desulfurococcales archaeon]|nr:DUF115 domain-containing protein [Desulfurococcales archaeon]
MDLRDPFLWYSVYEVIRRDMGYDLVRDLDAALILRSMLNTPHFESSPLATLNAAVNRKDALVVGAGPNCVECSEYAGSYDVVIAADGGLRCCRHVGVEPDIVVTDLDGLTVKDLLSFRGVVVVHAHGDNIDRVREFLSWLTRSDVELIGTVQVPTVDSRTFVFGGFTDGDRAAYLAYYFNAQKIGLAGFDMRGFVGRFSKPWLSSDVKAGRAKLRKLFWASVLIHWLKSLGGADVECVACEGEGWI